MIANNSLLYSAKILVEIIRDVVYFPFWWYTRGLFMFAQKTITFLQTKEKSLGLFVWMKNIFTPMYGQNDWQGVLISILVRIVQIIFRSIVMIIFTVIAVFVFMLWIFVPIFIVYELIFQTTSLKFDWIFELFS